MRGFDCFEGPKIVGLQAHALRVTATQSLGNPSVVQSLSVAKLKVAGEQTQCKTEHKSAGSASIVGVIIVGQIHGLVSIVSKRECSANNSVSHCRGATQDLIAILRIEESHVPVVRVVLDCLNQLNLSQHFIVAFFNIVMVSMNMMMTSSHY